MTITFRFFPFPLVLASALSALAAEPPPPPPEHPDTETDLRLIVGEQLLEDGSVPPRQNYLSTPFSSLRNTEELWNLIEQSSHTVMIGIRGTQVRGVFNGTILVSEQEVQEGIDALRQIDGVELLSEEMPPLWDGRPYPAVPAQLRDVGTLKIVRELGFVDFVEPRFMFMDAFSGCSSPYPTYSGGSGDFQSDTQTSAGDIIPWSYSHLNVVKAWSRSSIPGNGRKVAVIDTGVSPSQEQFGTEFLVGRGPAMTCPGNLGPAEA